MIIPVFFSAMVYCCIGFDQSFTNWIIFTLILVGGCSVGTSFGFLLGCMTDNINAALALTNIVVTLPIMFNGIVANISTFPWYIKWVTYISVFRYESEAMCHLEFGKLDEQGLIAFNPVEVFEYNIGMWPCIIILYGLTVIF